MIIMEKEVQYVFEPTFSQPTYDATFWHILFTSPRPYRARRAPVHHAELVVTQIRRRASRHTALHLGYLCEAPLHGVDR